MMNLWIRTGMFLGVFQPAVALAQVPSTVCGPLIGCPGGSSPSPVTPANIILQNIGDVAEFLVGIAAGLAVLFIVFAGFQMVISLGNDSKLTEQRWAILYALGGLAVAVVSQLAVSFVGTQDFGQGSSGAGVPVSIMRSGVSILLTVFNATFVMAVIIGGLYMLYAQGKSDTFNTGRRIVFWSVIGAVVANLANALVQALAGIFGV